MKWRSMSEDSRQRAAAHQGAHRRLRAHRPSRKLRRHRRQEHLRIACSQRWGRSTWWRPRTRPRERFAHQEQVWDAVWYRRIAYFLTVGVTIATVSPRASARQHQRSHSAVGLPDGVGDHRPARRHAAGGGRPIVEHFVTYPSQLVAGGLAALLLMQFSSFVERRNGDSMRKIWAQQPPPAPSAFLRFARRVRKSDWYSPGARQPPLSIAPNVFGVLMLLLIVVGVAIVTIRVSFDVPMILGQVCKDVANPPTPTTERLRAPGVRPDESVPSDGRHLKAGETYVLSVEPHEVRWRDLTVPVTTLKGFRPEGFSREDWIFWLSIPIRRHKVMDWYVPVARVGAYGDHYFPITNWTTEITPQTDGQLFLYVNDALWL